MSPPSLRCWLAAFLVAGLAPASLGCAASSHGTGDASAPAVRINDQEISCGDFEAYLKASFGEELPSADDAETRSRLLDQFIEERLLLQQAQARHLQVGNDKIQAYLDSLGAGTEGGLRGKPVDETFREQIRETLLIQEFKDQVLLKEVHVTPEEVEAYFREHPQEFREARVVVLRQILLEEAGEAKKVLAALRQDPGQFQVLAERHSASPDKGQPRPFEEEELPETIRTTVFALQPGQVSDVVEEGGRYRIFQAVDRHEGKNLGLEDVRKKIEMQLLQLKVQETLTRSLEDLRKSAKIQVHLKNLPFHYTGDYGG